MQKTFKTGFTLVELLVVIAIIGILASIIMVSLTTARAKGRDGRRIADIKSIQLALEMYYNDNLMYPKNIYSVSNNPAPTSGLSPNYLPSVPTDPLGTGYGCGWNGSAMVTNGTGQYCYAAQSVTVSNTCNSANLPVKYHLGAVLEVSANDGTGNYAQDVDLAANPGSTCSASTVNSDFNGLSSGCTTSGTNGTTGTAENCYDVVNQ